VKVEAIRSSETKVTTYKITRRHNPEDHNRHLHRRENLKSQNVPLSYLISWRCLIIVLCITAAKQSQNRLESQNVPLAY
jgi:hypothetical protein